MKLNDIKQIKSKKRKWKIRSFHWTDKKITEIKVSGNEKLKSYAIESEKRNSNQERNAFSSFVKRRTLMIACCTRIHDELNKSSSSSAGKVLQN